MKTVLVLLGLAILLYWIGNNVFSQAKYTGFYYPDADDLLSHVQSPEFNSLEQCREWVGEVSGGRTDMNFDYECGKNCKLRNESGMSICDETLE